MIRKISRKSCHLRSGPSAPTSAYVIRGVTLFVLGPLALGGPVSAQTSAAGAGVNKVSREDIEWLDVWLPDTNDNNLPRVLLIGDSITRGYYPEVEKAFAGRAYVGRLTTSKSLGDPALLKEVALVLSQQHYQVIHFNNGRREGWTWTESRGS